MLRRAKAILGTNSFTALYDKGYHTGSEFKVANDIGVDTLVAVPGIGRASQAPDPAYNTAFIERNARRVTEKPGIYRKRQALVEHPFGTIKRQWAFDRIITKKGLPAASADFGSTVLAYNLKRLMKLGWEAGRNIKQPMGDLKTLFMYIERLKMDHWPLSPYP
ncbi:hypothetical protein ACNR9Q_15125 [Maribacter sp. X9]